MEALFLLLPSRSLGRCFSAPGFAGGTTQLSLHALSAVATVDALVSRVGSALAAGAIVTGGKVDLSSWILRNCLLDGVFRFGSPAPILHQYSDASTSGWGSCLLVRSRLHGVLEARDVPHLSSQFPGVVFDVALHSDWGHRSSCAHDVWRLAGWLPSTCRAVLCPASSACWPVALWCCSSVSTSTSLSLSTRAVLCSGGSPQPSGSSRGPAWSFHLPVATALLCAWSFPSFDLLATVLPAVLPLFCSLVLNHRVVFLDAFRVHWAALGLSAFRPSFCRMGVTRVGEAILSGALVPSSDRGGFGSWSIPSPSRGFTGYLPSWQGVSVSNFRLSVGPYLCRGPAGLGSHALSWIFLCSLEISWCPSDLQSCVPPRGLSLSYLCPWHEICAFLLVLGLAVLCQVTALPPSPCLVWNCRHAPCSFVSSLSLQSCAWFILLLRSGLLG